MAAVLLTVAMHNRSTAETCSRDMPLSRAAITNRETIHRWMLVLSMIVVVEVEGVGVVVEEVGEAGVVVVGTGDHCCLCLLNFFSL